MLLAENPAKAFASLKKDLSEKEINELINYCPKVVTKYFRQEVANESLTKYLLVKEKESTLETIKRNRSFLMENHAEILFSTDLIEKTSELQFWNRIYKKAERKKLKHDGVLSVIGIEDLVCRLVILYEFDRAHNPTLNIDNPNVLCVLNRIINRKIKLGNFGIFSTCKDEFLGIFKRTLRKLKGNNSVWEQTKLMYKDYDRFDNLEHHLEHYINYDSELEIKTDNCARLIMSEPDFLKVWTQNGMKISYRNKYLQEINRNILGNYWNGNLAELKYSLHSLPSKLKLENGSTFRAENFLNTLKYFGDHANTWNYFADRFFSKFKLKRDGVFFRKLEESSSRYSPLLVFQENELYAKSENDAELTVIMGMLSIDFNNHNALREAININYRPFFKIGENYISCCGVIANKNYGDGLATRVRRLDKDGQYGSFFEEKIIGLFATSHFNIFHGKYRKRKGGVKGEFDLLAYKDGVLFMIEIKSTYGRGMVREIAQHRLGAITKAKKQLERGYNELKSDYSYLRQELVINEEFEQLKICPLIVSNNFEHEEVLFSSDVFKTGIRKISDFELEVILLDTLLIMLRDPSITIWRDRFDSCPGFLLKNAIDKRMIWEDLFEKFRKQESVLNKLEIEEISIEYESYFHFG